MAAEADDERSVAPKPQYLSLLWGLVEEEGAGGSGGRTDASVRRHSRVDAPRRGLVVSRIRRFDQPVYGSASAAFVNHGAIIDQLVGDEAIGLFLPGFVGQDHPCVAYRAARELLTATGHGPGSEPWVPVGIGVHTGTAFIGSIGSEQNFTDFTAVGDVVNTTARLASAAGPGEIVISSTAVESSSIDTADMRNASLTLKGKEASIPVYVTSIE
ncbi:MAG: adenylate/guanylate cyclase domain-containing protein [Gammaproteobacteria bacterium]|nr:adenylate/guanylate cyclase domain-containing protein [Gammaproteobacteria bacterium]